jgi:hypothetical protein
VSAEGETGRAAIRDQDVRVVRHDARGFRDALERCDVAVLVMIDDLDAVPPRMRKNTRRVFGSNVP